MIRTLLAYFIILVFIVSLFFGFQYLLGGIFIPKYLIYASIILALGNFLIYRLRERWTLIFAKNSLLSKIASSKLSVVASVTLWLSALGWLIRGASLEYPHYMTAYGSQYIIVPFVYSLLAISFWYNRRKQ